MRYLLLSLMLFGAAAGLPWPHHPTDSVHPIGNAWGNFQNYGMPYLHNGQDIMTGPLVPCVAIEPGYVKRVWLGGSPMYNGVTVADSAGAAFCEGFMYYHLDNTTIRVQNGDTIQVGDTLGLIARWSTAEFHHNHFSENRDTGVIWQNYGAFFRNPLLDLTPDNDSMMPRFLDAYTNQRFAICANNASSYQGKDSVYGTVDLICRLEEQINHRTWLVVVYKLEYTIRDTLGNTVVPLTRGFEFCDSIESYTREQSRVVFKQDATCNTYCNYDSLSRRYYYIFTNTDGDSLIEATDSIAGWNTTLVADGAYWVKVIASDEYGNSVADSMLVRVKNNPVNRHDVGVMAIAAPPLLVDPGDTVVPACTVYNYGNFTESYDVRMRIGTVYDSTATVTGHAPATSQEVVFPAWLVQGPPALLAVTCSTRLTGDTAPANDRRTGSTRVALHDVGATAILAPTDTVDSGAVVVPRAVVRNFGDAAETFDVLFFIGSSYVDQQPKRLMAGATDTIDFAGWTAHPPGAHPTRCSTRLAGDDDPSNDRVEDTVVVRPQVGLAGEDRVPRMLVFHGAQPNPVSGPAFVRYELPRPEQVALALYDASGRLVATLWSGGQPAGVHRIRLDGAHLATGVYWLRFRAGDLVETQKLAVSR